MSLIPTTQGEVMGGTIPAGAYVQLRAIPGVSSVDKFGANPLIVSTSDPEDIWEFGGVYPYDANGTAPIRYVSSSSALDVGNIISVQGLDIEGKLSTEEIVTNGQNNVTLSTPLWRVWRMENESPTGGDISGILYCHTDAAPTAGVPSTANVRAIMSNGNNQTLMSVYTIPKGKVGLLFKGEFGMNAPPGQGIPTPVTAKVRYESRRYGKVFKIKKELDLMSSGSSNYVDVRSFPDLIPELTDIRMRVEEVSDDCGIWSTLDILLFDIGSVPHNLQELLGY